MTKKKREEKKKDQPGDEMIYLAYGLYSPFWRETKIKSGSEAETMRSPTGLIPDFVQLTSLYDPEPIAQHGLRPLLSFRNQEDAPTHHPPTPTHTHTYRPFGWRQFFN